MTNQKDFETIIVTFPNGKKIETEVEKLRTEVETVRANGPNTCPTGLIGPFGETPEPSEAESRA